MYTKILTFLAIFTAFSVFSDVTKQLAVFGGSFSVIPASQTAKDAWRNAICCEITDFGKGGCGFIVGSGGGKNVLGQVKSAIASGIKFDAFVFWASTNDLRLHDVEKQNSQIEKAIAYVRAEVPDAKVLFFTSLPVPLKPAMNAELASFVDGQIAVCQKLNVPYLDLYTQSGITTNNAASVTSKDKLHLLPAGYELIKDVQVEFLKKNL